MTLRKISLVFGIIQDRTLELIKLAVVMKGIYLWRYVGMEQQDRMWSIFDVFNVLILPIMILRDASVLLLVSSYLSNLFILLGSFLDQVVCMCTYEVKGDIPQEIELCKLL